MSRLQNLKDLQSNAENIRNICILAHVDHGKTTLSDSLLASNGIISSKLSGKVRYLDSREDEQERGITMKSSGISLCFKLRRGIRNVATEEVTIQESDYLINLIDSPGHVDFSSEVSTASRLCDGCLILVDAVEGVCTQTLTVLKQAWKENVKPILVFNKLDRLIVELQMSPNEAFIHMKQILEQFNAITATLFTQERIEEDARKYDEQMRKEADESELHIRGSGATATAAENTTSISEWVLEEKDDSALYFSPELGNVVFASAMDGWCFRIHQFAQLYASKLGIKESLLRKVLWGEYYLDPKNKRVVGPKGLKGRALKPMFVQFVLENIWNVYSAVLAQSGDRAKVEKIVGALNLKITPRDLKSKDSKSLLNTLMSQWMPLSSAILVSVIEIVPSPKEAQPIRIPAILHPNATKQSAPISGSLEWEICSCSADPLVPVVAYISKVFSVPTKELPSFKKKRVQLTAEELREKRRLKLAALQDGGDGWTAADDIAPSLPTIITSEGGTTTVISPSEASGESLIGFARIYSGTIKQNNPLEDVLGPKYDPKFPHLHRTQITVEHLYLLMGRELEELNQVPAGNVFGIGWNFGSGSTNASIATAFLKTATLSSVLECPSFGSLKLEAAPIVRVALEPRDPGEMSRLLEGLKLLNQADPCVEVLVQETGEHVIVTAGELHLERCLKDLRERFARIDIQVSAPIVPFRETLSMSPSGGYSTLKSFISTSFSSIIDRVQIGQKVSSNSSSELKELAEDLPPGTVRVSTPNKLFQITVRAMPLPHAIIKFLMDSEMDLKRMIEFDSGSNVKSTADDEEENSSSSQFRFLHTISDLAVKAKRDGALPCESPIWDSLSDRLWDFGPKKIGPNMLVNGMEVYKSKQWNVDKKKPQNSDEIEISLEEDDIDLLNSTLDQVHLGNDNFAKSVNDYQASIVSGFQLAVASGPLCGEPMSGVCFAIQDAKFFIDENTEKMKVGLLSGQIIATVREACRLAFLGWSSRLMLAMYSCELQAPADVLGKVYAVLNKRRGQILLEEMKEGTPYFNIKSLLPVVESFGFSEDIRKRTSGAASPQLIFQGFETMDQDPFWVPTTEEELEELGEKADRENLARKYMDVVRKRKGLFVEKKIVEHAEKQKTLKSK